MEVYMDVSKPEFNPYPYLGFIQGVGVTINQHLPHWGCRDGIRELILVC